MNRISLGLLFAPIMLLILAGCQKDEEKGEPLIRPVLSQIVVPQRRPVPSFAGTVQPKVQTIFGPRVTGLLVARDVDIGDTVTRGQLLAALDPTALELAVGSARADLANAEATLANAVSVERRTRALFKVGTETQATVESTEQASAAAEASVIQSRSALSKAEEQLSYTQVKAAFDGVVTQTGAEVGQVVAAGATVVTVARPEARDAVVDVPDGNALFPVGTPFSVSLQIDPAKMVAGKVREVAPAADPATRTRRVKIALKNPPASFRLGTTITASLEEAVVEQVLLPATAVFLRDGKSYVWVVDEGGGTVKAREVVTGPQAGNGTVITSGIEAGIRVVTAGVHSLEEGQAVKVEDGAGS
ncbi:efflux RND transporter periplasmic adaptor subunit [Pararhizobium sp. YC-54]|uniref:efflux RND transporter periplasmic adaptor subunit n=1 Tax=Pararhizobium sp. YC-54 TaxID=2986920 RepID=UPI0021F6BAF0|nr:efflux RND transporter periplasmic adaptor subunit [Pararhizobium sp. YC-54]MCW0000863.1 efflux RND transporter periplasmic adaptor subunit [Pararhizobium sp. YC-54]